MAQQYGAPGAVQDTQGRGGGAPQPDVTAVMRVRGASHAFVLEIFDNRERYCVMCVSLTVYSCIRDDKLFWDFHNDRKDEYKEAIAEELRELEQLEAAHAAERAARERAPSIDGGVGSGIDGEVGSPASSMSSL